MINVIGTWHGVLVGERHENQFFGRAKVAACSTSAAFDLVVTN